MSEAQLTVSDVTLRFGGVSALNSVSFDLEKGHILGLIGPNGAGKTSLVNVITGAYTANEGSIMLGGTEILSLQPHERARLGLCRTFQNLSLFTGMTVFENVMVGRHLHVRDRVLNNLIPLPGRWLSDDERRGVEIVDGLLHRLGLSDLRDHEVNLLSYGYQKRVELARALASEAKLLLLDEPFAGMTSAESRELARVILDLWDERGLTLLIIEHNMGLIMDVADRVVVLDFGRVVARGEPDSVRNSPDVIRAYLGAEVLVGDNRGVAL